MTARLLAIDVGNSSIHLGLWQAGAWARTRRVRSEPPLTPDDFAALLPGANIGPDDIDGAVVGSVVPALTAAFCDLVPQYLRLQPLVVTHETDCGLRLDVERPSQAGADRIANALAAWALHGGPAIVIDFGTATTFDVVTADGAWRGGAIAPGVGIARDALAQRAARLPAVDLAPPPHALGRNTIHAMQSGIFWGYVGLVEGLVARLRPSAGDDARVIATGGLAGRFGPHLPLIDIVAPLLTLDGLRLIYERNA